VNLQELAELSDKQIKKLLKRVDTSHIAPALKVLPIQLQKKVLRNMGSGERNCRNSNRRKAPYPTLIAQLRPCDQRS